MAKASSKTHATPVIFGYADYRQYLRDYYQQMKAVRPEFSFRFLAKRGGFASPNFFKLVMEGKRNLSPQGVTKVARALKLSRAESAFFRNLVNFNQSKNTVQKEHHASELLQSEKYKRMHPLNDAQYQYYSQWFLIPIRELVGAPGFREDPAWIARQMNPPISTEDAKKALKDLLALGILQRDPKGQLRQNTGALMTSDEVTSAAIAQYHRHMLRLAGEAIDRIPKPERDISSITILASEEACAQIKEMIRNLRDQIMDVVARDELKSPKVYQANFQFFPLSHPVVKSK